MSNSYSKTTPVNPPFDLREYTNDRSLALITQERLSKIRARYAGDMQNVLRQAKKLRQRLIEEARTAQRSGPT